MKLLKSLLFSAILVAGFSSVSSAKCFHFSNSGGDVGVCVPGDSFDSRKKAKKICDSKVGNCGNVTSSSSSCHSNVGKCYNENGSASRDLRGY